MKIEKVLRILISIIILYFALYLDGQVSINRQSGENSIIVNSAPSLIAALFIPLSYYFYKFDSDKNLLKNCLALIFGFFLYEIFQIAISHATFDYFDLIFTILGGLLFYIIYSVTEKLKIAI